MANVDFWDTLDGEWVYIHVFMCVLIHVSVGVERIGDGRMEDRVLKVHSQSIDLGIGRVLYMHVSVCMY